MSFLNQSPKFLAALRPLILMNSFFVRGVILTVGMLAGHIASLTKTDKSGRAKAHSKPMRLKPPFSYLN